ncbi:uncharacterized protein LOC107614962 [Arachis ipaensis]|uniref:uncharacterized protein LOC107614962 n=1 Tax=Arachis ipaensis TaxID=130454 RepID=UPI0007AF1EB1|nr:uncharacterized protein LOC107614962 [Arachis ipaensis]
MKHREVYDWFVRKCNVYLNSTYITRALKVTRKFVEGDEIAQCGLVWDYANELLTSNPGSRVQVGVIPMPESPPLFDRFYVCLDACKRILHEGQILTACGQDANNHIFVIAYAIVSVTNKDNWQWFLELLHSDLGDYRENKWCFISDIQKGLIPAIQEVFPRVHHRFCVWHLWRNFSKKWGSCELKDLVWECARSRTTAEFDRNMKRVKLINEKAWQHLDKWSKEAWTKAHLSEVPKVDNICNNACESFNAKIKHERSKPILTLAEEIRRIIMNSMVDNRKNLQNYQGIFPPVQQSRLEAMTVLSRHWAPQWSGDEKEELYEVHGWPTNMVVDLEGAEPELNAASTDADNGTEVEAPLSSLPSPIQSPSEIDISQSESIPPTQDTQQDQLVGRPPKLQVIKRKARLTSSPKPTATGSVAVSAETIKGTSSGITKRLANFMSFVPTPSFKAPRKNDDKV